MDPVNLAAKFDQFSERWSPRIVGRVDDYDVKIVKLEGEFVWHKHDGEDELFLVLDGVMSIEMRDRTVELGAGEMFVVPRGVEHRPFAASECRALLFERRGVVNTGDAPEGALTNAAVEL